MTKRGQGERCSAAANPSKAASSRFSLKIIYFEDSLQLQNQCDKKKSPGGGGRGWFRDSKSLFTGRAKSTGPLNTQWIHSLHGSFNDTDKHTIFQACTSRRKKQLQLQLRMSCAVARGLPPQRWKEVCDVSAGVGGRGREGGDRPCFKGTASIIVLEKAVIYVCINRSVLWQPWKLVGT